MLFWLARHDGRTLRPTSGRLRRSTTECSPKSSKSARTERGIFPPQPMQFGPLVRRQPVTASALVPIGLANPVPTTRQSPITIDSLITDRQITNVLS
jgi:hypothetical protein